MERLYKCGLLVIEKEKILLCKASSIEELITPGGVIEEGENCQDCLIRELYEELGAGVKIQSESIEYIGNFIAAAAGKKDTLVEIELYQAQIAGEIKACDEIESLVFFGEDDDPFRLSVIIRDHIIPYLILTRKLHWKVDKYYERRAEENYLRNALE